MRLSFLLLLPAALLLIHPPLRAYSVLTHEAIIDSAWDQSVRPLLLWRFPQTTPEDLNQAHAYAYGGCILQDMGYYPFGSKFFSDLVHYVRSGDFVMALLRESEDVNEYAFALGALAHYNADTDGHSIAVNPAVAIEYVKLRRKYGSKVTYAQNPTAHIRVEFSFDVLQVARGNYAPQSYHDFIGFKVSKPVLERAFRDTYGLELKDVFASLDLGLATYRHAVSAVIPEMTKAAWKANRHELAQSMPGVTRAKFVYNLSRASYRKDWPEQYEKPGIGIRILTFVLRVLPKVGPLRALAFRPPTPQTARLFEDSFDKTMDAYRASLAAHGRGSLSLPNRDFDTGQLTRPTEYPLADDAYAKLAVKLTEKDKPDADPELRSNILEFFHDLDLPYATRRDSGEWRKTLAALARLKAQPAAAGGNSSSR